MKVQTAIILLSLALIVFGRYQLKDKNSDFIEKGCASVYFFGGCALLVLSVVFGRYMQEVIF